MAPDASGCGKSRRGEAVVFSLKVMPSVLGATQDVVWLKLDGRCTKYLSTE